MKFNYEDVLLLAKAVAAETREIVERKAAPYIERAQEGLFIGRIAAEQLQYVAAVRIEQVKQEIDARFGTSFSKAANSDENAQMEKELADLLKALGQQSNTPAEDEAIISQTEDQLAALFGKAASPEEAEAILRAIFGEDAVKSQEVTPPEVRVEKPVAAAQKEEKPATKKVPGTKKTGSKQKRQP